MTTEELNAAAAEESLRAALRSDDEDESRPTGGVVPSGGSLEGVMLLMKQLIESMPANIAASVKVVSHTATWTMRSWMSAISNASIPSAISTVTWKEWKNQFAYAVAECDIAFAATMAKMEKQDKSVDPMSDLTVTQNQLSAVLFNRLQSVTTGTASTMVLSAEGNGCEGWRLTGFSTHKPTSV